MFSYIPTYTVYLISLQYAIEKTFQKRFSLEIKFSILNSKINNEEESKMIYYTSDLHFGQKSLLATGKWKERPFETLKRCMQHRLRDGTIRSQMAMISILQEM